MFACYLDESYRRGESYWLAGALFPAEEVIGIARAVDGVAAELAPFGIAPDVELHGKDVFHGNNDFQPLHGTAGIEPRLTIFRRTFRAMEAANAKLLFCGCEWNTDQGQGDLDLHRMTSMEHFFPILQSSLQALGSHALVIADEERATTTDVLAAARKHKAGLRHANVEPRLLDNVLFLPSHDSRGIQALDLAAFIHRRLEANEDAAKPRVLKETRRLRNIYSPLVLDSTKHPAPKSP